VATFLGGFQHRARSTSIPENSEILLSEHQFERHFFSVGNYYEILHSPSQSNNPTGATQDKFGM
jgi:hypothetical protein